MGPHRRLSGPGRARRKRALLLLPLLALLVGLVYLLAARQESDPRTSVEGGVLVRRDVTYCTAAGTALKMDLYVPPPLEDRPAPVLVYIHGGGWQSGDKSWVNRVLLPRDLVARGYLVAAVDYRLAPQHKWPAQIEDVKCAIRHLRANAADYHLDAERIGVWGESAGGHLAALLGLTTPADGFEGASGYGGVSSRVHAVIDMCGPADLAAVELNPANMLLSHLLVGFQPDEEFLRRVSPVSYAAATAPPFLILHGDRDDVVPADHSRSLHQELAAAGARSTLVMVENATHVFAPAGGVVSPTLTEINWMAADFFDGVLQPGIAGVHNFAQTHKTVRGRFLDFWRARGGVPYPGYPVSHALREGEVTVQYFERAVLQLTSGGAGAPEVSALPLGALRYAEKYPSGAPDQTANAGPGSRLFPETGRYVGGRFLEYWNAQGGLAAHGYPISDELAEASAVDGTPLTVQYFERSVFERYPGREAPHDVGMMALGRARYRSLYPGGE